MPSARKSHCFRSLWLVLVSQALLILSSAARAQEADSNAAPPAGESAPVVDRTIYVPFKNLKDVLDKQAASAIVPYDKYLEFLRGTSPGQEGQPPAEAVITSAEYTASVVGELARITAIYQIKVLGKPWVELPLVFGDAAIGKVEGGGDKVLLRGTGDGAYALLLGAAGEQTVRVELLARVRTSPEGREFSLKVPAVGITTFELTVPEAEQTIEFTPRLVALPAEAAAGTTVVKANLGATRSITARWHPKATLKPEMELLASVTNRQLVTIEGGYVHHDAWLTYDVLRGKLSTMRFAVPLGQRVLDVTADAGVKSWQAVDEAQRQVVTVELLAPAEKSVTLEVHTERTSAAGADLIAGADDAGAVYGVHALDAVRESGQVAIRAEDGLELTVAEQQGVTRIAAGDVDPRLQPGAATAFKFYAPVFRLAVTARPVEPRVLVTQTSHEIFEEDELRVESTLSYQVERAGVFELRLKVPDNLIIDDVQSPQRQSDAFDAATRILTVKLQQSTQGAMELVIKAHRPFEAGKDQTEQDLPILEPLDVARETGTVLVFAPPGIEVVTSSTGLQSAQPAPAEAEARGEAVLRSSWSYTRRPVRIPVTTTRKPTRLSATIATAIELLPETIEVATTLVYTVEFAGVDTFRFLVPSDVSAGLQIEAVAMGPGSADIQQQSAGPEENGWIPWTVVMQRKVLGAQGLRITYRRTRDVAPAGAEPAANPPAAGNAAPPETSAVTLRLIRPQGKPETADGSAPVPLTQLKGEVRIVKERSLSVTAEASGGDVEPIDIRELTLLPATGALAYRYYRQPDDGAIEIQLTPTKHAIQEVTPTLVEQGLVEIATGRHTAATYRCRYLVKSVERQRLRIDLPAKLELLGVFINGTEEKLNPLSPAEAGTLPETIEAYSVNISRHNRSEEAFVLTLQFNWNVNPAPFEGVFGRGEIAFPLPRVGGSASPAPVQDLTTVVYVPQQYWLVGTPERFQVLGERDWWDGLGGEPTPHTPPVPAAFQSASTSPLDFPTDGLTATAYQILGGAGQITVVWWDILKMSLVLSISLALVGFILVRTSWENKLSMLLLLGFAALLFGIKDRDGLAHGLAAARYGLGFMLLLWVVRGILSGPPAAAPLAAAPAGSGTTLPSASATPANATATGASPPAASGGDSAAGT